MAKWKKLTDVSVKSHYKMTLFFISFMASIIVFSFLAHEISSRGSLVFDEPLLLFIHGYASTFLNVFFTAVTHLGDSIIVLILAMVLATYFAYKRRYERALLLVVGMGGIVVANTVLKFLFQRDRPTLWQHIVAETNFSFPSGHAMVSAGFAMMLIILFWNTKYRWITVALATIGTFLVGLSRLYLGVHYPSDILAGWCVSAAWVMFVVASTFFFSRKKTAS